MLLNVFCFLFLFRLFSFSAEICNRNTNCHCAFTRSQSALKACIRLGIEILWLVWCINDALITLSTRELIVYLIWNLSLLHWTFYRIIIGSIHWHMQIFLGDTAFSRRFGSKKAVIVIIKEKLQTTTEMYSEHSQIYKMEQFVKMVNCLKPIFN